MGTHQVDGLDATVEKNPVHFGQMLKFWRKVFAVSQEELAARIDSASRHISRLEKGDAIPNKDMVVRIAKALSLGDRDTINLLFSAGYIDLGDVPNLSSPDFRFRREEFVIGLKALDPNPAALVDMSGHALMVNRAWVVFETLLGPGWFLGEGSNIFQFLLDYAERQPPQQKWGGTLSVLMLWLQQLQSLNGSENAGITTLLQRFEDSPHLPADWQKRAASREGGRKFQLNFLLNGEACSFLLHTYVENIFGPLTLSSKSQMFVTTLIPDDSGAELFQGLSLGLRHPLLFY